MSLVEQQMDILKFDPSLGRVIGVGVDIIETEKVGRDAEEMPEFVEEFCTQEEIVYCNSVLSEERRNRFARLFSLKEATIKALGGAGDTGQEIELDWREIIVREEDTDSSLIELRGRARERANKLGITSLSGVFTEIKGTPIVFCIAQG